MEPVSGSINKQYNIKNTGNDPLSQENLVPWALEDLTTVFGMGTGVTPPL